MISCRSGQIMQWMLLLISSNPFFGTKFMANAPIFMAMLDSQQETEEVKRILNKLCKGCLETTKTQLADFFSRSREGKYHGVQDDDTRKQLQHSKLTNLIGEQAFGDLDFSLFERCNASLHHHSTINMLKRNKSISTFLSLKTRRTAQPPSSSTVQAEGGSSAEKATPR